MFKFPSVCVAWHRNGGLRRVSWVITQVYAIWAVVLIEKVLIPMYRNSRVITFRFSGRTQWHMYLSCVLKAPVDRYCRPKQKCGINKNQKKETSRKLPEWTRASQVKQSYLFPPYSQTLTSVSLKWQRHVTKSKILKWHQDIAQLGTFRQNKPLS